ncbi:Cof-type HAD-IIB family hydrolase [Alkalibacter mobilis]|uniref:Cof-type HAD-IIB family hydrolase n=1 Tax=Alkalibacter mobilis TaxID=2787712 RepID=UPI00189F55E9|nr:Cof-type HAD-IIB family hydrolase [Alkalibacter mobilis]MBF7096495.1 HAD family phosphatase [Alkalibacter mobilis]
MKYKLIAVDIDGTLLNSQGILTQKTKEQIRRAHEAGVIFTISTGRPIQGVMPLVEEIGLDIPLITYNGAMVLKANTHEIIYEKSLINESALKIYKMGLKIDTTMILWSENKLYSNVDNEKSRFYSGLTNTPMEVIDDIGRLKENITKIIWYENDIKVLELMDMLDREFEDKRVVYHPSRPYFLEFVDSEASKAIAIAKLGEIYGIRREEIIAVGDSYNDISMIEFAGLGVAMDNAPKIIKDKADYITKSCDDDGVAHVIDKIIFGG